MYNGPSDIVQCNLAKADPSPSLAMYSVWMRKYKLKLSAKFVYILFYSKVSPSGILKPSYLSGIIWGQTINTFSAQNMDILFYVLHLIHAFGDVI